MKAKTRIIIACILIPVISLAVTLIIVRAGIHKVKKLAMPEISTEAEETFKGKPVEMSTEEIVALYNEAFNNTAKSEKIVSNGHFLVDRDKSSWTNTKSEKLSKVGINLLCSMLDYSDYEMNGDSSASLTAEDVLYLDGGLFRHIDHRTGGVTLSVAAAVGITDFTVQQIDDG